MQKKSIQKVVNFSIILLLTLTLGLVAIFHDKQKTVMADPSIDHYATTLTHNETFISKTTNKTITGLAGGKFAYGDRVYNENLPGVDFEANDTIMLHNYNKTIGNNAENIYLSFGNQYTSANAESHPVLTDIQTVTIYVNGVYQENIAPITTNMDGSNPLRIGDYTSNYWYAYFDLNSDTFGNYGQGSYSIGFAYNIYSYNETTGAYEASNNLTYRFDFTLVDQNTYAQGYTNHNNFPDVIDATNYVENGTFYTQDTLKYYYNYSLSQAPVLEYDVENYNISYTHSTNTFTNTYTTWVARNGENLILHTLRDGVQVSEITVGRTDGHYLHNITFDTQGTYDITIRYQMRVSATEYRILEDVPVSNYGFDAKYPTNSVADDKIQINVFGAKAYYNRDGVATPLYYQNGSTTLDADFTARLYSTKGLTTYNQVSTSTPLGNSDESYNSAKDYFPVTNQGPVSFSYYGTMTYDGSTSNSYYYKYNTLTDLQNGQNGQKVVLPKETAISEIGYYEVTLVYTSNNAHNNTTTFYQKFVFAIVSGEPEVGIYLGEGEDSPIKSKYTNQDVHVITNPTSVFDNTVIDTINQEVFCLPFTTSYRIKNFDQSTFGGSLNLNSTTRLTDNGHYQVIVTYGVSSRKTYEFTIDKSSPMSPTPTLVLPIRASKDNPNIIGYAKDETRNITHLTNDWFLMEYDAYKASGAKVNVTYKKYNFAYNTDLLKDNTSTGYLVNDNGYIASGYILDGSQSVEKNDYAVSVLQNGTYSISSILKPTEPSLYVFTLVDDAGNTTSYAVLFDNSAPTLLVDPEPNNNYNMVTDDTTITWGTHKTLHYTNLDDELQNHVASLTSSELTIRNNTIALPLTTITVSYTEGDQARNVTYVPTRVTQLQLKAVNGTTNVEQGIFVGEDIYTITALDTSMVSSVDTSKSYTIELNLDQSVGLVYVGSTSEPRTRITNLNTGNVSNADGLYFSYITGDSSSPYYLEQSDVTYDYYPFDPTAYATSGSRETFDDMLALINDIIAQANRDGISADMLTRITPYYPFVSSAKLTNVVVSRSNTLVAPNAENNRVISNCINPSSIDGKTEQGMYVFRREYKHNFEASSTTDSKVRYYVMIIDRSAIFDIDASTVDRTNTDNPYDLAFYFNNGGGISFTVGNGSSLYTMDGLAIENYIQNPMAGSIMFRTNKLPVTLSFPNSKYNAYDALGRWIDTLSSSLTEEELSYIRTWYEKTKFNFVINDTTTNTLPATLTLATSVAGGSGVMSRDLTLDVTNNNFAYTYRCMEAGEYTLTLTDQAGNTQRITFEIVYDSPTGSLKGKNNVTLPTINGYEYKASNTDELYFEFETYLDQLQANIDVTNIIIEQMTTTSTNTYIVEYVKDSGTTNVYRNNKSASSFISSNNGVLSTQNISGGTRYTLTLLPANYEGTLLPFDPEVEATYLITVEYENFSGLGLVSSAYRRTFSITIDRTAPTLNLQSLINKDKYYGADVLNANKQLLDTYFLAVSDVDALTYYGELENSQLYYRTIKVTTNEYGVTDDSYPTYTPTRFFSPSAKDDMTGRDLFTLVRAFAPELTGSTLSFGDIFTEYGYYELVELDEAGNYTIYPVYYFNPDTTLYFTYKNADSDTTDTTLQAIISPDGLSLADEGTTLPLDNMTLAKKELQLSDEAILSADAWQKVIIAYGSSATTLQLDPTGQNGYTTLSEWVTAFNTTLQELENADNGIHSFTITFVNRLGEDYTLTYLTPTGELRLIFHDISTSEFSVTIPTDTATGGQTVIESFNVYRFTENGYINILRDSVDNPITAHAGRTYYFRDGQYKFEYTDNFKRSNTEYHSKGADYFHSIVFYNAQTGATVPSMTLPVKETIDGVEATNPITYLAHTALIEFDTKVYQYMIRVYDEETGSYVDYTRLNAYRNNLFTVSVTQSTANPAHNLIEIYLTQNETLSHLRFLVILKYTDRQNENEEMPEGEYYRFEITHELPELHLLNYSGVTIQNVSTIPQEPTQFSEDIYITWDECAFGQEITLIKDNAVSIKITEQNYCIKEEGYYKLSIMNGLAYHSDFNSTSLYFRRTSSDIVMYEVIAVSSDGLRETILSASPQRSRYVDPADETQTPYPVYEYYKLENTNTDIRLNKNKNLDVTVVEESDNWVLYKIFGSSDYGYIRYVKVHSIKASNTLVADSNDNNRNSLTIVDNNLVNSIGAPLALHYENKIQCTSKDGLTLSWNYYHYNDYDPSDHGNIILASYYYNNQFVDTIYETDKENTLRLNAAGYYQFVFRDLSGNVQQFVINGTTYNYLFFYIVNDVLFTVNNAEPVPYQIFNSSVTIRLTNRDLYDPGVAIAVKKDGKEYTVTSTGTSGNYVYTFTDHGSYVVTLTSYVRDINGANTEIKTITTQYVFTIINANQVLLGYHISPSNNFTVTSLIKDNVNITNLVEDKSSLWLSKMSYGDGRYTVSLTYYHETLKTTIPFSFDIWINSEVPTLVASIDWGTSTSKPITVSFNMNVIYQQIGDSYISINGLEPIWINSVTASTNQRTDITINSIGDNWVSLYTADGQLVNSYRVTRTEPLNTLSIVLIVVGSIVAVGLIVLFIFLRRRMKVR